MESFLQKAKDAKGAFSKINSGKKSKIIEAMGLALIKRCDEIVEKNSIDVEYAKENNLSASLLDRLILDKKRVEAMGCSLKEIALLKEPVGRVLDGWINSDGLRIEKVSIPIGVIGVIYESRPNVTSDVAGLCFKSGNVAVLKGGKEAQNSNEIITHIIQDVLQEHSLPKELVSLLPNSSRDGVKEFIKMDRYVDLIIPRGGEGLIRFVNENSTIPVVKHDKGLCHLYIHSEADTKKAIDIAINAKVQRPGVCNAIETLLVDSKIAKEILPSIVTAFREHNTKLLGCQKSMAIVDIARASEDDYYKEYLDNILSIKVVDDLEDAINHISKYGSGHSDAIVSNSILAVERFLDGVDSACVYANASTRFTDGGCFGFGAEVGISTNKLHARGPMGINDLTTYKYKVIGDGTIRA